MKKVSNLFRHLAQQSPGGSVFFFYGRHQDFADLRGFFLEKACASLENYAGRRFQRHASPGQGLFQTEKKIFLYDGPLTSKDKSLDLDLKEGHVFLARGMNLSSFPKTIVSKDMMPKHVFSVPCYDVDAYEIEAFLKKCYPSLDPSMRQKCLLSLTTSPRQGILMLKVLDSMPVPYDPLIIESLTDTLVSSFEHQGLKTFFQKGRTWSRLGFATPPDIPSFMGFIKGLAKACHLLGHIRYSENPKDYIEALKKKVYPPFFGHESALAMNLRTMTRQDFYFLHLELLDLENSLKSTRPSMISLVHRVDFLQTFFWSRKRLT